MQSSPVVPDPDLDADGKPVPDDHVPGFEPVETGERHRVVCQWLNVRLEPTLFSAVRALVRRGDELIVTEKKTVDGFEWGKIEKGWVALKQIPEALTEKI